MLSVEQLEQLGYELLLEEDFDRDLTAFMKNDYIYYHSKRYKVACYSKELKGFFVKEI